MSEEQAAQNTDREIWRARFGDYYAPSIHATDRGAIGISVGGTVIVKTVEAWHELALSEIIHRPVTEAELCNHERPFCHDTPECSRTEAAPGGLSEGVLRDAVIEVLSDLEGGFVRCNRCGDQEDTATLDCVEILKSALKRSRLPTPAPNRDAELKAAVLTLISALNDDVGYRESWKSNIAMAFKDEMKRDGDNIHEAANRAAENFLDLLTYRAQFEIKGEGK